MGQGFGSTRGIGWAGTRIAIVSPYIHYPHQPSQVERDIYERQWRYVPGFLETFVEQEDAFVQLIEGLYPTGSQLDKSARDALRCVRTHVAWA